ncbi:MAG TPA: rhodanese-like domain-containing protein [Planctomycetota bacterium]|nr:rhodanese-like domain-containing protein [Planctomycetota bacterium]
MILQQHYLACLSQASYLIGDEESATAIVVDPRRDVDVYLDEARRLGLTVRHVFLTHFHADFVSGHLELARRAGARIHLGARARADYPFTPVREGDRLELGKLRLEVLETPGHTPESISILVYDLAADPERPHAVLTGDALFIGDVGRPDLLASEGFEASELASMLYDSLHGKLMRLPDATLVYPAHGAGSACGKNLSQETVSTIGAQRKLNYALQPMSRERFVELVSSGQPEMPAYFAHDAALNRRERPTLEETLQRSLRPLSLEEALRMRNAGAVLLDVRDPDDYARGHLSGSTNIGLGGRFASWAGTLLERERAIVVVAEPGREREAVLRLGRIGFDQVAGYLENGPRAFERRADLVASHPRIDPAELAQRRSSARPPLVLDVRTQPEWAAGAIEGSLNLPLAQLERSLDRIPRGGEIAVHCQSGYRSSIAASLLEQAGFQPLSDLAGGWLAWEAAQPSSQAAR